MGNLLADAWDNQRIGFHSFDESLCMNGLPFPGDDTGVDDTGGGQLFFGVSQRSAENNEIFVLWDVWQSWK